jgi:FKBP-type peptidyl-prolyl cis-trans isomerase FklB
MQLKGNLGRFDEFKTIKYQLITKAFEKIMSGDSIEASNEMLGMTINNFLKKKHEIVYAKNLKEGKEFLEMNKKNSDVHVLPSGLQYKVIKEGTGPIPDSSSLVSVNYTGTLVNGEQFETTIGIGKQPLQTPVVGQTIKGWTEALLKMKVGSKWKIFIPAELAYGEQTSGKIKAGMALIFEMELLSIDPKPAAQPNMGQPMGGPNMSGPNPRMRMQMKK